MLPLGCPGPPGAGARGRDRHHCCCRFWSLFLRRIFFLRHFHLAFPRFFQSLELRFIGDSPFSGRTRPVPSAWAVTGPDTTRTFMGFSDARQAFRGLARRPPRTETGQPEWRARRDRRRTAVRRGPRRARPRGGPVGIRTRDHRLSPTFHPVPRRPVQYPVYATGPRNCQTPLPVFIVISPCHIGMAGWILNSIFQ